MITRLPVFITETLFTNETMKTKFLIKKILTKDYNFEFSTVKYVICKVYKSTHCIYYFHCWLLFYKNYYSFRQTGSIQNRKNFKRFKFCDFYFT
jgi:hypothetical protein